MDGTEKRVQGPFALTVKIRHSADYLPSSGLPARSVNYPQKASAAGPKGTIQFRSLSIKYKEADRYTFWFVQRTERYGEYRVLVQTAHFGSYREQIGTENTECQCFLELLRLRP